MSGEYIVISPVPQNLVLRYGKRTAVLWPSRRIVPVQRTPTAVAMPHGVAEPVQCQPAVSQPAQARRARNQGTFEYASSSVKLANMTALYATSSRIPTMNTDRQLRAQSTRSRAVGAAAALRAACDGATHRSAAGAQRARARCRQPERLPIVAAAEIPPRQSWTGRRWRGRAGTRLRDFRFAEFGPPRAGDAGRRHRLPMFRARRAAHAGARHGQADGRAARRLADASESPRPWPGSPCPRDDGLPGHAAGVFTSAGL